MGSTDSESVEPITRKEHNPDAAAKRTVIRAQDPVSGNWVNISAVDNGDGTYSLSTNLSAGDIQIGAVEIKDGDSSTRLDVESDGTKNAAYVQMNKALPAGTNNIGDVDVLSLPAIPTGTNTIGSVKITDGTDTATVRDLTNADPLDVAIVDGSGNQITSFGGGTQYAEDSGHTTGDTGTMSLGVRNDAQATRTSANNDYSPISTDDSGATFIKDRDFATRIDEASATVTYIGSAAPGTAASAASWLIKKIDSSSGTIITFADGDPQFNNVWNDRASLTYS